MAIPIVRNTYSFPFGYRGYVAFLGGDSYVPWNGYNNGANAPSNTMLGAVLQLITSGAPSDTQILTIFGPDGKTYKFQFLYAGTPGNDTEAISIALPNSGASTAAQVMTAFLAIASLSSAFTQGGASIKLPWIAQQINATTCRLNFNIAGSLSSVVTPTNMTSAFLAQPVPGKAGLSSSICAAIGKVGAFLPGP